MPLWSTAAACAAMGACYVGYRKNMHQWIVHDTLRTIWMKAFFRKPSKTHLLFAFVDHFEPGNRKADPSRQIERVRAWTERYPEMAGRHRDADGVHPQHTFFFPPHYDTHDHLERIVDLCSRGFGEVEMHLHHDHQSPWPDTETTLRNKLLDCIERFSRHGVFCLPDGRKSYGFIHGDWALANSRKGGAFCGVNNETALLKETGCFADFTFPVSNESQPWLTNTFFYGNSFSDRPKSYACQPIPMAVGKPAPSERLLLMQGIIGLRWKSRKAAHKPSIEQSNVDASDSPTPGRVDYWVNKWVHVSGRPEWVFIKVHTHGAREEDRDVLLGEGADRLFRYLEEAYDDGRRFVLHYVSAREMYNIARAAEAGKSGDPNLYRDFVVPRYVYLNPRRG